MYQNCRSLRNSSTAISFRGNKRGGEMWRKRAWRSWPKRVAAELNGVSGVAGIGGAALSAGSFTFLAGSLATGITGIGAAVLVCATGYAAFKAIPPAYRSANELVGKNLTLADLSNVFPRIPLMSIVGPSQVGKTTLKNRLSFNPSAVDRTQEISAYVISLLTTPPTFVAILDGGGERYPQQFKLVELSDIVLLIADHNKSDNDGTVDKKRLHDTELFFNQIRHHLDETGAKRKSWIHILLNKKDLWSTDVEVRRKFLTKSLSKEEKKWKSGNYSRKVTFSIHSNESPLDVASLMELIKREMVACNSDGNE